MIPLVPLAIGLLFGALLDRAGLTHYEKVVGVYRLRDFTLLKFLGTAIVVGAATVQAARSLGFVSTIPIVPTHLAANAVGGALFGVGMAVAGFCPGTILGGAGGGRIDSLFAGGAGLFVGALAFGLTYRHFQPGLARVGALGAATLPSSLGVAGWLLVALFAEVALLGFYAIESRAASRTDHENRARS